MKNHDRKPAAESTSGRERELDVEELEQVSGGREVLQNFGRILSEGVNTIASEQKRRLMISKVNNNSNHG